MILITGAAGKTGKVVLRSLVDRGEAVRALVFHPEQIQGIQSLGAEQALAGDLRDSDLVSRAVKGIHSIYHICPNVHPDEVTIGQSLIDAAVVEGISHFVYHSVLHPQVEAMPHHWKKMRVEERLFASGLDFTILQPAAYMQNLLANWKDIVETGKYRVPYSGETRISLVDLEDIASAATIVLTETYPETSRPAHSGATYELVGTPGLYQVEVADILSQSLGRKILAESIQLEAWETNARKSGMSDYQVDTLIKMFKYYQDYGFEGNSNVLEWLLPRPITDLSSFLKRVTAQDVRLQKTTEPQR